MRKKVIVGNWKMYKTIKEAKVFADGFKSIFNNTEHEVGICCPYTQIESLKAAFEGTNVKVGAQNMHFENEGAFTGEISPVMLNELNVDYCIIGHSERRQYFNELDVTVNKKLKAAIAHGIQPIMCVGEHLEQRDAGEAFKVVEDQIKIGLEGIEKKDAADLIIAYEPIWAIGTGRTATQEQAQEMCGFIRNTIKVIYDDATGENVRIQYGGSVKPKNAAELLNSPDIDGALVGGASLNPEDFNGIVEF